MPQTSWVVTLVAVLVGASLAAADLDVLKIGRNAIALDGKLDEPEWGKAAVGKDFSTLVFEKKPAPAQTTSFSVLADDEAIYVGVTCMEDMSTLRAKITLADNPELAWDDDLLEVFLCPTGMNDSWYQFVATAGGCLWSQFFKEKGQIKPDPYRPYWRSAVHKAADFWSIEIMIPLASLYMTPAEQFKPEWLFNIGRQRSGASANCTSWSRLNHAFNESHHFRTVSGFPAKPAARDMFIKSIVPKVEFADGAACIGKAIVIIESAAAARGEYTLKVNVSGQEFTRDVVLDAGQVTAVVDKVRFPRSGKVWAAAELADAQGQVLLGRYYPLVMQYEGLTWTFSRPGYKRCFYPGQDATRISGRLRVNLPEVELAKTEAEITVKPDALPAQKVTVRPDHGEVSFDFDLKSDQYATAEIAVTVRQDGKVLPDFQGTQSIRNLPPKKGMDVLWVENGTLVVNGKPRFLLSFFAPEWIVSAAWKAKYPTPPARCPQVEPRALLLPNLEMNRLIPNIEREEGYLDVKPKAALFEAIRARVEENRERTDFWFYYLADEPECRQVSATYMKHLYDYITELDPYHAVYIISREPATYADCADVLSTHSYTSPYMEEDGAYKLGNAVSTVRAHGTPLVDLRRSDVGWNYSPQLFSYRWYNRYAEHARFDDSQATVWSAIANGCMGINAYTFDGFTSAIDLEHGYAYMYESIRHLEGYLLSPTRLPVTVSNAGEPADAMLAEFDGDHLLVLVNVMPQATRVTVSATALKRYPTLHRFREATQVAVADGGFTLELAPWQVVILTGKKVDGTLSTLAALRAGMAAEKQAAADRKNLLAGWRHKVEIVTSPLSFNYYVGAAAAPALFDGHLLGSAWYAEPMDDSQPGFFEVDFPDGSPTFSRMALHHANCNHAKVTIWKRGEWLALPEKSRTDERFLTAIDFGEPFTTVKFRIHFDKLQRKAGNFYEIYELELLE